MKKLFKKETRTLLLITLLLLVVQIPAYFLLNNESLNYIMFGFLLLFLIITLLSGTVTGLFSALIFIFVVGSILFYFSFQEKLLVLRAQTLEPLHFLIYGFVAIILILITGRINEHITEAANKNEELNERIKQYVAVDVETGFDNKHRMELDIDTEIHRVNRYGGTFTLILLQMDHFVKFEELYGAKETKFLLQTLSEKIQASLRATDRKFRYENDRFALLLTHTNDAAIDVVYEKIAEQIKTHQLKNGRTVTLTFRSGHMSYEQGTAENNWQSLIARVESEMMSREL